MPRMGRWIAEHRVVVVCSHPFNRRLSDLVIKSLTVPFLFRQSGRREPPTFSPLKERRSFTNDGNSKILVLETACSNRVISSCCFPVSEAWRNCRSTASWLSLGSVSWRKILISFRIPLCGSKRAMACSQQFPWASLWMSRKMIPHEKPDVKSSRLYVAGRLRSGPNVHAASSSSHCRPSRSSEEPSDLFTDDGDNAGRFAIREHAGHKGSRCGNPARRSTTKPKSRCGTQGHDFQI